MFRLGIVIDDNWRFFSELYEDLENHYNPKIFKKRTFNLPIFNARINRLLFDRDLNTFLKSNDVILFEWANELLATATQLPKQSAIVVRLHRYEMYEWVNRINWELVDKIILVSRAKEKEFINRFPSLVNKTIVIPVGINTNRFETKVKKFNGNIGILCDLKPRKRVYDLILGFYELLQKDNSFHLHIGGGPDSVYDDYYLAILDVINMLKLQEKVTLYGNVTETEKWYQNIDIFISNSYSEGLQVAPMEAMASGCYCLSHFWNGADELLPKKYLFFSSDELNQKILQYSSKSEGEKQEILSFMRNHVCENFNIESVKNKIRTVLEDTANTIIAKDGSRQ